ncbi:hypothetical protein TVAGG3_1009530 [Trichomonas vaginalis G3]|uniref:hypothetical protein n=1 Tax=Trichomonas vaginalis (strain ATCC PRA-98 / G3) TaxID=412133 RepID=UPI0021E53871|nr:hypothetical protein TVAGG3_1009530 [Trichomonas vaginalis G3]KAI5491385.1 hypothetical protein TVAGG3_1009530 [Trichomonas vaginalis G3]
MQSRFVNRIENPYARNAAPTKLNPARNRTPLGAIKNTERERDTNAQSAFTFKRTQNLRSFEETPEKMFLQNPEQPYDAVWFEFEEDNTLIKDDLELESMPNIQAIRW